MEKRNKKIELGKWNQENGIRQMELGITKMELRKWTC